MSARQALNLLRASVFQQTQAEKLFFREATKDSDGGTLLYMADPHAQVHVLAPVLPDYAFTPLKGARLELGEWVNPDTLQRYLDLTCRADELIGVFSVLADDVVSRIEARDQSCSTALLGALQDWRELMKPARALSEEAARGLFGELTVLYLLAQRNPIYAVECWTGPEMERHDFCTPQGDLEVKTSSKEAFEVTISSLSQLDPRDGLPLILLRIAVETSATGENITDMVSKLVDAGCLQAPLIQKLVNAGFLWGSDPDEHRFVVKGPIMAWAVDEAFPGLRTPDIPEVRAQAITRLRYTLSLVESPGLQSEDQIASFIEKAMTQ